ncbi:MAG: hypothetical protein M0R21_05650 [Lentimicrobiaceae bacterium]|nr:hypothetical protein [Lentimicrobiaceae bacterium]
MKRTIIISFLLLLTVMVLHANVITVKQDGTGNYTLIQQGINAAAGGDTVLVYPGIYYENINYNSKNITLASLYLLYHADSLVRQTVIDGSHLESVVTVKNNADTAVLCGFTIQNGKGHDPLSTLPTGGGIYLYHSNIQIHNCIIKDNESVMGGGILCNGSQMFLSGVTVNGNHSTVIGGGISFCCDSRVEFDTTNLCNIYLNYSAWGNDISVTSLSPPLNVVVDTFTVMNPGFNSIISINSNGIPLNDVTVSIKNAKVESVNADLYVSPEGDNKNDGLNPQYPLRTISFALVKMISDSLHPNTIHLTKGIYSPLRTGEMLPLNLSSFNSVSGEQKDSTIIDGDSLYSHIKVNCKTKNITLKDFTLKNGFYLDEAYIAAISSIYMRSSSNIALENINITDNSTALGTFSSLTTLFNGIDQLHLNKVNIINNFSGQPLPIGTEDTLSKTFYVENCKINNNKPDGDPDTWDGGYTSIFGYGYPTSILKGTIANTEITQNERDVTGGISASEAMVLSNFAKVDMVNCTIGDNTSPVGGAISIDYGAELNIYNSIIYGNTLPNAYLFNFENNDPCKLSITHSLVEGGRQSLIDYTGNNTILYNAGNIDTIPCWDTQGEFPYALTFYSPCINAGMNEIPGITIPQTDLAGKKRIVYGTIDMGAYEFQDTIDGIFPVIKKTVNTSLTAYPNPFDEYTTLCYHQAKAGKVIIAVYDQNGIRVKVLTDAMLSAGDYRYIWEGKNGDGSKLPAGIYLCKAWMNNKPSGECRLVKK